MVYKGLNVLAPDCINGLFIKTSEVHIIKTYDQMKTHNQEYLKVGTICMKIRLQFLLLYILKVLNKLTWPACIHRSLDAIRSNFTDCAPW